MREFERGKEFCALGFICGSMGFFSDLGFGGLCPSATFRGKVALP